MTNFTIDITGSGVGCPDSSGIINTLMNNCSSYCQDQINNYLIGDYTTLPVVIGVVSLIQLSLYKYDFGLEDEKRLSLISSLMYVNIVLVIGFLLQIYFMVKG